MEPFLFLWIFKWKRASDCILLSKTEARLHNCTLCTLHSNWIPDHTQKNHSLADLKHLFEICRFLILSALIDLDECVETICEMSMLMLIVKDLTICCSILDTGGNPFIATAFLPSALKCNWSSSLQIPTTSLHQDGNGWQLKIGWRSKMAIEMF